MGMGTGKVLQLGLFIFLICFQTYLKSVGSVIHWSCVTEGMLKLKINLVVNKSKVLA